MEILQNFVAFSEYTDSKISKNACHIIHFHAKISLILGVGTWNSTSETAPEYSGSFLKEEEEWQTLRELWKLGYFCGLVILKEFSCETNVFFVGLQITTCHMIQCTKESSKWSIRVS